MAFWLMGESPTTRRIGLFAGALAGAGCALAFDFVYGGNNRAGAERLFIGLAGMVPGVSLGYFLARRAANKVKKAVGPAT